MNDIASILDNVTTPLALAALCLIIGAGIINKALSIKSPARAKQVLTYGFILALIISIFANISYIYERSLDREIRIAGTVRSEAGVFIDGAIVDIAGKGRGITDKYGAFSFVIPDAWSGESYEILVSSEGYVLAKLKLNSRKPEPVTVILQKNKVNLSDLWRIDNSITLGHYLGIPIIQIAMYATNEKFKSIRLQGPNIILQSPSGKRLTLFMDSLIGANGMSLPALQMIQLKKGDQWNSTYVYASRFGPDFFPLSNKANAYLTEHHPDYLMRQPDPNTSILSDEIASALVDYMNRNFTWEAGTWTMETSIIIEGDKENKKIYDFTISEAQVNSLKNISEHYHSGIGALIQWRTWRSQDIEPFVSTILNLKANKQTQPTSFVVD